MRLTNATDMARVDDATFSSDVLPEAALMETAGQMVARHARRILDPEPGSPVVILAGKGHNGADALVAARWFHRWGYSLRVWLPCSPDECASLTRTHLDGLNRLPRLSVNTKNKPSIPDSSGLIVDGLLGTGLAGDPRSPYDETIQAANQSSVPVVSVDSPSGLSGDEPIPYDPCVQADLTVTFGLPKLGQVAEPGYATVGRLVVQGLTFPDDILDQETSDAHLITPHEAADWLPHRNPTDHKGTAGRVGIIAGSENFPGAPQLVADAAGRSGAGLISLFMPEIPSVPYPGNADVIYPETQADLLQQEDTRPLNNQDAWVIGPGLGRDLASADLIDFLDSLHGPAVIDADGLNLLASRLGEVADDTDMILTPHPGEAARLLDREVAWVLNNQLEATRILRDHSEQTVVLKSSRPVVAHPHPEGSYSLNVAGDPALATAGSGDVLSGILGALLAAGLEPGPATCLGLYLHGAAGRAAAEKMSRRSVRAEDLPDQLPAAVQTLENGSIPDWFPVEIESVSSSVLRWHPWMD